MALINTIINNIGQRVQNNELGDDELFELIEYIGDNFLGLKTISYKAKELNTDYNNVKKSRLRKRVLFGVKFVVDNE